MTSSDLFFIAPIPKSCQTSSSYHGRQPTLRRHPARAPVSLRNMRKSPNMLAKYQKKESQSSNLPEDDERPLDQILPPPILPTLNTLTNETPIEAQSPTDITIQNPSPPTTDGEDEESQDILPKDPQLVQMGVGLSKEEESALVQFFKGMWEEFQSIEWTSFDRVIRLTILVIVIVIVATASLYVVDGFLSRIAKVLFEDSSF